MLYGGVVGGLSEFRDGIRRRKKESRVKVANDDDSSTSNIRWYDTKYNYREIYKYIEDNFIDIFWDKERWWCGVYVSVCGVNGK